MSLYRLQDLKKVYGSRVVLDVEELVLQPGRIYGLMGPNGAGKTTLLETLAFLSPPTSGRLEYDSRPVDYNGFGLNRLRREVVLAPQTPILFTMSVRKNVEFGLKVRKIPKKDRERQVMAGLELVGMRDFADMRGDKLSGGETQRAAIARALACRPKVILLDEPTANVDLESRAAIEQTILRINRELGISVILTTHDILQAARLTRDLIYLYNGKPVDSIFENIFSAAVEVRSDGISVCRVQNQFSLPIQTDRTGEVKLTVKPEMIDLFPVGAEPEVPEALPGRVIQLNDEGGRIRLVVDVGLPLSVLMNGEKYRSRPLLPGAEVRVHCPPESLELI